MIEKEELKCFLPEMFLKREILGIFSFSRTVVFIVFIKKILLWKAKQVSHKIGWHKLI